jgi:ATP-binding cassette subfamily C (CFTR/MRP) protein 10
MMVVLIAICMSIEALFFILWCFQLYYYYKYIKFLNPISVKMSGYEDIVVELSNIHRQSELSALSRRKYLDAICVFLWAITPLLVPFGTFYAIVISGQKLSAASIFTTLSLLNMLIFPINALPWIVNGFIEAKVRCVFINIRTYLSLHIYDVFAYFR